MVLLWRDFALPQGSREPNAMGRELGLFDKELSWINGDGFVRKALYSYLVGR